MIIEMNFDDTLHNSIKEKNTHKKQKSRENKPKTWLVILGHDNQQ